MSAYDAKRLVVVVHGVPLIQGLAGDGVVIEHDGESFVLDKGIDGSFVFSKNNLRSATLSITVLQNSSNYLILKSLAMAQRILAQTAGLPPVMPVVITDPSTAQVMTFSYACFEDEPVGSYGQRQGEQTFTLRAPEVTVVPGILAAVP